MVGVSASETPKKTYLVTGATGRVGRALVKRLRREAIVRAVSRGEAALPPDVETVLGDFTTGKLSASAFTGVEVAFVFPAQGGVAEFIKQAALHGVQRFVLLSSLAAAQEHARDKESISALHHLEIEAQVKASGLPCTILRPGTFASNLLFWAHSIRAYGMVQGPYAQSRQAPIHEADIAAVAVAALTDERHAGKIYALSGPQALTRVEQLDAIGAAIGRQLRYVEIPPRDFEIAMAQFIPSPVIKMLLDHWSDTMTAPDAIQTGVEEVTGHKALTLEQWARDHAEHFS